MKIVVTGALGHIGSSLIRGIPTVYPDAEVVLVDNLATQRYCSLFNLPSTGRYRFVEADILQADLLDLFDGADVVVHLAAITDAAASFANADQVELVNYDGAARVADACLKTGSQLIFLSTTSVYGSQKDVVDEDCAPEELAPQSPYALSKLRAEHLIRGMTQRGMQSVVLRFGTIFGVSPGMRFHTAVNKFAWQACVGEPVTVWRTALHQKRPYLDLADGIRAMLFVMERHQFDGEVYNVVTTNTTVSEILDCIRQRVADLRVEFVDTPIMNQLSYTVARQKFESLGFSFRGDLDRGLDETIMLLRNVRST